jgi:hypothetical protein
VVIDRYTLEIAAGIVSFVRLLHDLNLGGDQNDRATVLPETVGKCQDGERTKNIWLEKLG